MRHHAGHSMSLFLLPTTRTSTSLVIPPSQTWLSGSRGRYHAAAAAATATPAHFIAGTVISSHRGTVQLLAEAS